MKYIHTFDGNEPIEVKGEYDDAMKALVNYCQDGETLDDSAYIHTRVIRDGFELPPINLKDYVNEELENAEREAVEEAAEWAEHERIELANLGVI